MAKFLSVREASTREEIMINFDWVKKIAYNPHTSKCEIYFISPDGSSNNEDCIAVADSYYDLEDALIDKGDK